MKLYAELNFPNGIPIEDPSFGILCQTKEDILFITDKSVTKIFETQSDLELAKTKMLFSQNGKNYFVSKELSSQTNFIHEVMVR